VSHFLNILCAISA